MTADRSFPELRILIGASSFSDAAAALRLVERLPHPLFSGLGGLLIAEPEMFVACQIPRQRVVLPSGTTVLAPAVAQLRLLLQADARAFQDAISRTAESAHASWVFEQDQGDLISTSLRAASGWDVLLMGYRRFHAKTGKVIVLTNAGPINDEMNRMSERLAREFAADRVVFSIAAPTSASDTAQKPASYRFETLDDCMHALARTNGLAVLLDLSRGPVCSQRELTRVLDAARCPVMVFGASTATATLEHSTQIPAAQTSGPPR